MVKPQRRVIWMEGYDSGICAREIEVQISQVRSGVKLLAWQNCRIENSFSIFAASEMHEGGITSVHFNPANTLQVLTNGLDSCLKLVDIRTGMAIQTLRHPEFTTSQSWSSSVLSPDGHFAAAGSNSNGKIFIWDLQDDAGVVKKKLTGHNAAICAIDWGRGGASGQQVASIDRKGGMILWA